jgi:hypothetical protein
MARRFRRDAAILFPAVGAQLISSTGIFIVPFIVAALMAAGCSRWSAAGSHGEGWPCGPDGTRRLTA